MSAVRLDHIGVAVRSIDDALRFYRGSLGVEPSRRVVVEQEQAEIAMLRVGDPRIELIEPTAEDSPVQKFLDKRGEGLHHIALEVDDLEAAVERLTANGARLTDDEIRIGAEGYRYVFIHPKSAGGVLIELIERT